MAKYSGVQYLLETSVFLYNTDRIDKKVFNIKVCQGLLQQANGTYVNVINATAQITIDPDKDDSIYLLISFLRETLGPFLVKWESVFFTSNKKFKRHVSGKQKKEMRLDFLAIQEVVRGLCDDLDALREKDKEEQKTKKKEGKPIQRKGIV